MGSQQASLGSQLDKPRLFLVATNREHANIAIIINAIVLYILVFMYLLEIKLLLLKSPASRLFTQSFIKAQIKENSKLRVAGLCAGNSPWTGEFPIRIASNAENVSIFVLPPLRCEDEFLRWSSFPMALTHWTQEDVAKITRE